MSSPARGRAAVARRRAEDEPGDPRALDRNVLERVEDGRLVRSVPFAERDARRARGNRGRAAPAHEEGALGILAELEDEEPRGEERRGGEEEAEEAFHFVAGCGGAAFVAGAMIFVMAGRRSGETSRIGSGLPS